MNSIDLSINQVYLVYKNTINLCDTLRKKMLYETTS